MTFRHTTTSKDYNVNYSPRELRAEKYVFTAFQERNAITSLLSIKPLVAWKLVNVSNIEAIIILVNYKKEKKKKTAKLYKCQIK